MTQVALTDRAAEHIGISRGPTAKDCEELARAIGGNVGDSAGEIQKQILTYYEDVRGQAAGSFRTARGVAIAGFVVLCITVGYVMIMDFALRWNVVPQGSGNMTVGSLGLIAGAIVEFLAATQFWLHSRTSRQFGAFHICLERTHRYLLAYKIAETITTGKDKTLEKVVCIMANAPMITREDIEGVATGKLLPDTTKAVETTLKKAAFD